MLEHVEASNHGAFAPQSYKKMNTDNQLSTQANIPASGTITAFRDIEQMFRVAEYLSKSTIVPKAFFGQPGSVMIALNMAQRLRTDPFMIMQNITVVNGSAGMSGKFAAALLNCSPKYTRIEYVYINGKDHTEGMRVVGHRRDGKKDTGTAITPEMVKAEGWDRNPKWSSMPEQMYRYRSASFFARAYTPEELMGMSTTEEIQDMEVSGMRPVSPTKETAPTGGIKLASEAGEEIDDDPGVIPGEIVEEEQADAPQSKVAEVMALAEMEGISIKEIHHVAQKMRVMRSIDEELPEKAAEAILKEWDQAVKIILTRREGGNA